MKEKVVIFWSLGKAAQRGLELGPRWQSGIPAMFGEERAFALLCWPLHCPGGFLRFSWESAAGRSPEPNGDYNNGQQVLNVYYPLGTGLGAL